MKKFFKKVFKKIKKIVKPIGKALKTGMGSISKALGPVGTLALSLMMPGIGAAWASFAGAGGLAATTGGVLGGVMKGIAAAGNAVGTVFSSVSGMMGRVVKAIPGVGDAYTKLADFTTRMMDKGRMAMGLPTSGKITAANTAQAANDMSVELEPMKIDAKTQRKSLLEFEPDLKVEMKESELFTSGGDMNLNVDGRLPEQRMQNLDGVPIGGEVTASPLKTKMSSFTQEDWDTLGIDKNVNRDFTDMEMAKIKDYTPVGATVDTKSLAYTKDLEATEFFTPKPTFEVTQGPKPTATVLDTDDFIDQQAYNNPDGIIKVKTNMQVDTVNIGNTSTDRLTSDTIDVKRSDLSKEQLRKIADIDREYNYFNTRADNIMADATLEDGTINPEYTEMNKNMVGLKRGTAIAAAGEGLVNSLSEVEPVGGGVSSAPPMLDTEITGATDYSQAYAGAYQGAGFVGPNDFNSFANAGYYGGDPFSIAQYNRRVPTPQANIRIGA